MSQKADEVRKAECPPERATKANNPLIAQPGTTPSESLSARPQNMKTGLGQMGPSSQSFMLPNNAQKPSMLLLHA